MDSDQPGRKKNKGYTALNPIRADRDKPRKQLVQVNWKFDELGAALEQTQKRNEKTRVDRKEKLEQRSMG